MVKTLVIWMVIHVYAKIDSMTPPSLNVYSLRYVCCHMITIGIVLSANLWVYSGHVKLWSRAVSRLVWSLFFCAITVLLCSVRIRAYAISTSKPTQLRTRNAVLSETVYENSFLHKICRYFVCKCDLCIWDSWIVLHANQHLPLVVVAGWLPGSPWRKLGMLRGPCN